MRLSQEFLMFSRASSSSSIQSSRLRSSNIQLAQREGSLNLYVLQRSGKSLVKHIQVFSMPVTVGEATEEEIQEVYSANIYFW